MRGDGGVGCASPLEALAGAIRELAYDLNGNEFPTTKAALRTSAEEMLDLNGSGLTPRTIRGLAPVEMELYLPAMSEPIRIRQAKFREHPDQFKGSGVRGESGIGIEFIDISKEHMGRLARFIRGKDELDAGRPPGNAPWLSPASTTAAPPPGASPALPDVASPA